MTQSVRTRPLGTNAPTIFRWLASGDRPCLVTLQNAMEALKGSTGPNSLAHTLSPLNSKDIIRTIGNDL